MAGSGIVLLVVAAIAVFLIFDINQFKSNIETAASKAIGLQVRINGPMALSFSPFGVSAKDIHVAGKNGEIISLEKLKLGAELAPLLKKRLTVTSCELIKPVITIVKGSDGSLNFLPVGETQTQGGPGTAVSLHALKLSKGVFVYLDKTSGAKTELQDVNLALKDFSATGDILQSASFTGEFDCRAAHNTGFSLMDIKASVKAVKGKYTLEPLTIGSLDCSDKKPGQKTVMQGIDLTVKELSLADVADGGVRNSTFTGSLHCKEFRRNELRIENFRSPLTVAKGVVDLKSFTMDVFAAKGEGRARLDLGKTNPVYAVDVKVPRLDFTKLQESFGRKKLVGGKADLNASLTMTDKGDRNLLREMHGSFSLRGNDLVIYTMDLDKVISSYESSQTFNLVDLGGFFIAGPLSSVLLKGYHYGDLYYQTRGGQGTITRFVSSWQIKGGLATATDCAFATHANRIALKGRLNLVSTRYENLIVALLDEKGCAKFKQSINGPFDSPQIGAVSVVESVAGPFVNLYRKAKRFVSGGACQVFYTGAVKHPSR